jgi:RimJ/RimL family protein N-acetyltransferase
MQLREAEGRDAGAVVGLWTEAYFGEGEGGRTEPYALADFERAMAAGRVLVTGAPGEALGVVVLVAPGTPGMAVARDEEAELRLLAVSPRARRTGIGRALVDRCTDLAREEGWGAIALWSREYQTAAHRLYESLGYTRVPDRDTTDATGFARLAFRLQLGTEKRGAGRMARVENLNPRLEGSIVTLEPFGPEHVEGLWEAAQAEEIWQWLAPIGKERELFELWLELTREATESATEGPFVTCDSASGRVLGSSRFLNVRPADRVVEIGWTWLNPSAWRSGANVEAKLLMMRHAFETLDCVRVEFKTDARNRRSRAALAALPARFEGILRNHMIVPRIGQRDSAYYSVIDAEWPAVEARLKERLARNAAAASDEAAGGGDTRPAHAAPSKDRIVLHRTRDPADIDTLEPVWNALQEHHVGISPDFGPDTPPRSLAEAWRIRRGKYEHWLDDPDTFFVIAELDGKPVAYACVTVGPPYAAWDSGERLAELETLSVLPESRGSGVGAALIEAVWERLAQLGVDSMQIVTAETNARAQRFYERHGFAHRFSGYYGKRPR